MTKEGLCWHDFSGGMVSEGNDHMGFLVRMAGAVLVFLGGCGIGWRLAADKKQRVNLLQEMFHAIVLLYGDVEYGAVDMVEAIEELVRQVKYFQVFFHELAEKLRARSGYSLGMLWEEQMEKSRVMKLLEPDDMAIWHELGQQLGVLDRQTQLHTLALLEKRMEQQIREATDEYRALARVYHVLGVTLGIFTVILLL